MSIRKTAIVLGTILALGTAACGGDGGGAGEVIVRDSAGVSIVTSTGRGTWAAGEEWTLSEELRVGVDAGDPDLQFGSVVGVDADPDGFIYVLDGQARRVRIFDPEGALVHSFGRGGGGPGEFSQALSQPPGGIFVGPDGTLWIPDMGNQRLARFGPRGEVREGIPLQLEQGIPLLWTRSADRAVYKQVRQMALPGMPAVEAEPRDRIVRLDPASGEEEEVLSMPVGQSFGGMSAGGVPEIRIFAPEPLWTVLGDGRVVTGSNDRYSLEIRDAEGAIGTIVRRDVERRPVTPANESDLRALFAEAWEEAGVPPQMAGPLMEAVSFEPFWPALAQIVAGPEGTLWVQRVDPASSLDDLTMDDLQSGRWGSPEWDVFASDGAYLGVVRMPERFTPMRFVGDHLYGVHRDELEVQRVVRLRLGRG